MPGAPDTQPSLEERLEPHLPKFLAALAAAGAGLGVYGHLRRQRLSDDPALAAIQRASKGKLTYLAPGREEGQLDLRALKRIFGAGGGDVVFSNEVKAQPKLEGALLHGVKSRARGDVDILKGESRAFRRAFADGDKATEAALFQRYAPGSVPLTTRMSDLPAPMFGDRLKAYEAHLEKLFPNGYVIKTTTGAGTGGKFPTNAHGLAETLAAGGPEADVLKVLLRNPSKVVAQERIPIQQGNILDKLWGALRGTPSTREMRVHVFNGAVAPTLTLPRFSPFAAVSTAAQATEAENFVKDVLAKLPGKFQKGTFAFDVAPLAGGGFKIIESNPGYTSGFLSPGRNPLAGFQLHRALTGRASPLGAGIGAGAAAATVGAAANAMLADQGESGE